MPAISMFVPRVLARGITVGEEIADETEPVEVEGVAKWHEVQEGDMQRQAENAYMFRRSYTREFAMLCTPPGYGGPLSPELKMECYARDIGGVEWYCPQMTVDEFNALTIEDVGTDDTLEPDVPATEAPTNVDVPYVSQDGEVMSCTMGNWTGTPTSYAYQWKVDGNNVGDGTEHYTSTAGDVGHACTCVVTAMNAIGSTAAPESNSVVVA